MTAAPRLVVPKLATLRLATALAMALAVMPPVGAGAAPDVQPLDVLSIQAGSSPDVDIVVAGPPELAGTDLSGAQWTVRQAGAARPVRVERVSNEHLEVALVIDTSGSMQGAPMDAARAAAISFVERLPLGSKVGLVAFSDGPTVLSPMTPDPASLVPVISALAPSGETALYDGVVAASRLFGADPDARRTVVLLSDGGDTRSVARADDAVGALGSVQAPGYVISLVTPETDAGALQQLADGTGGRVVLAADPAAIPTVFQGVESTLTNQYRLTFPAEGSGQTPVSIRLTTPDLEARADRVVDLAVRSAAPAARVSEPRVLAVDDHAWMPIAGAGAVGLALLIVGLLAFASRRRSDPTARPNLLAPPERRVPLAGLTLRATNLAERSLRRGDRRERLNALLEQAGLAWRPGEFVLVAACSGFCGFVLGSLLLGGVAAGLVITAATFLGFRMVLTFRVNRRRAKFDEQLADTLQLIVGSLRAGYGLMAAVDGVARNAESPTAEEFGRIVMETRLGRDVAEALEAAARRVGNEDFDWVVEAIGINRAVGGNLAELLDTVGATIRSRSQIRRQIRALSAEGRLSASVLTGLPILMFVYTAVTNPDDFALLTGTTTGLVLLGIGVTLLTIGSLILRRLVRVVF